ncbi:heptosyltransferase I [Allopseudospirillum japonicum]|uniref:Heptosyltransferase I n=1 Tax=Allopseudospirillum japonicum TaxID=64971 RepID=A0A1H6U7R2_9GAMM|nr:glycosyltransferase family 9 protein [Allopseudospirillum japonicum]SEI88403.1 heptosyltransferase I [Allopseudospirillum japonicum]
MLPLSSPPQSICILRLSALGDVCNLVPSVRAIQKHWPRTSITWILGQAEYTLLEGLSGVELIPYDKKTGLAGMWRLRQQLKGRQFDVLLHMQQAIRASLLAKLAISAPIWLGYDSARAKDKQDWFCNHHLPPHPKAHVLESFLDFAYALGVPETPLCWDIPINEAAEREAFSWQPQTTEYVLISPCSTQRTRNFRNWSASGYAQVIEYLYHKYGLVTVLTGGRTVQETEYAQSIRHAVSTPLINAVGQTSLKALLALIRDARLVIAPDSGPVHMATAMQTPVVGLYATTNPQRAAPYLAQPWVVNKYPHAVQTYLNTQVEAVTWGQRVRHPQAMNLIQVEDVIARLDALIQHTA